MASDIWLRTILIVRKETRCSHSYRLTARILLYAPSNRQDNTYHGLCYTSRGALAATRNSSMDPPHEGSIRRPIASWTNALPLSYVPLPKGVDVAWNWWILWIRHCKLNTHPTVTLPMSNALPTRTKTRRVVEARFLITSSGPAVPVTRTWLLKLRILTTIWCEVGDKHCCDKISVARCTAVFDSGARGASPSPPGSRSLAEGRAETSWEQRNITESVNNFRIT